MDCKKTLFSIIVPVYNIENYIDECIGSVMAQKFDSMEMILVDDGSKDKSGELCDRNAMKYEKIRVIHQENLGLSEARNTGIRHANGQYLVFLDGDDKLANGALEGLQKVVIEEQEPDYIISRRKTLINGQEVECNYYFDEKIKRSKNAEVFEILYRMPDYWGGACIIVISREMVMHDNLFFIPRLLHEDEEWVPRVIFSKGKRAFNNSFLYVNRIEREGSITATLNIKRLFDKLQIAELLVKRFENCQFDQIETECMKTHAARIVFGTICDMYQYRRNEKFNNLLQNVKKHCYILGYNKGLPYKITKILCRTFGIKKTSYLLYIAKKVQSTRYL